MEFLEALILMSENKMNSQNRGERNFPYFPYFLVAPTKK